MKKLVLVRSKNGLEPEAVADPANDKVSLRYEIRPLIAILHAPVETTVYRVRGPLKRVSNGGFMDIDGHTILPDGRFRILEVHFDNSIKMIEGPYLSSYPEQLAQWINTNCSYEIVEVPSEEANY